MSKTPDRLAKPSTLLAKSANTRSRAIAASKTPSLSRASVKPAGVKASSSSAKTQSAGKASSRGKAPALAAKKSS
ncbi:MAG: hypothetical protein ACKODB_08410, partial [Betaproteobacteria bacterium]